VLAALVLLLAGALRRRFASALVALVLSARCG
jgi:hypothetical protein